MNAGKMPKTIDIEIKDDLIKSSKMLNDMWSGISTGTYDEH